MMHYIDIFQKALDLFEFDYENKLESVELMEQTRNMFFFHMET